MNNGLSFKSLAFLNFYMLPPFIFNQAILLLISTYTKVLFKSLLRWKRGRVIICQPGLTLKFIIERET